MAVRIRPSSGHLTLCAIALLCLAGPAVHAQWVNYRIPGIPRLPDGKVNLTAPVQRTPDGKPDLGGTWHSDGGYFGNLGRDLKNGELQMLPWAEAQVKDNQTNLHKNDPMVACMPPGVPRVSLGGSRGMPHPFKVVQTPSLVILLYETSTNQTFRQVFMDGRPFPNDPQPTWLGYSIGRWEGDTLVVSTTGFNGRSWIDTGSGHPQTDVAHVTERFTRRDIGHMDIDITIDDPKAYTKPWTVRVNQQIMVDTEILEFICLENQRFK
jgi:hypothetical protein